VFGWAAGLESVAFFVSSALGEMNNKRQASRWNLINLH